MIRPMLFIACSVCIVVSANGITPGLLKDTPIIAVVRFTELGSLDEVESAFAKSEKLNIPIRVISKLKGAISGDAMLVVSPSVDSSKALRALLGLWCLTTDLDILMFLESTDGGVALVGNSDSWIPVFGFDGRSYTIENLGSYFSAERYFKDREKFAAIVSNVDRLALPREPLVRNQRITDSYIRLYSDQSLAMVSVFGNEAVSIMLDGIVRDLEAVPDRMPPLPRAIFEEMSPTTLVEALAVFSRKTWSGMQRRQIEGIMIRLINTSTSESVFDNIELIGALKLELSFSAALNKISESRLQALQVIPFLATTFEEASAVRVKYACIYGLSQMLNEHPSLPTLAEFQADPTPYIESWSKFISEL